MNTGLWLVLVIGWVVGLTIVMALLYAHGVREVEHIEVSVE